MAGKEIIQKKIAAPKKKPQIKKFFREFVGEVKKLSWSTPKELISNSLTVVGFVAAFAVLIGVLDLVFGEGFTLLSSIVK